MNSSAAPLVDDVHAVEAAPALGSVPDPRAPEAAPAAPSAEWASTGERSNALALRVMCWIAVRCGRRIARAVLHPITLYFLLFAPGPRRHSRRYLTRALGRPAGWGDLYRHFHSFAATVLDRVYLLRGHVDQFDIHMREGQLVDDVLALGRGAFLVGAHMGSFEALRTVGVEGAPTPDGGWQRGEDSPGRRIAMVMYPDNARKINAALAAIAPGVVPDIIPLGRMDSMLAIRDWLDGGGLAGMLGDRGLGAGSPRERGVTVDFLGHPARFGDGPFRLAALLRRRVIFMVALYRGGNRYDVRFESLADFSDRSLGAAEREARITTAVQAYATRLESLCREAPHNWFNFHDFWKEE